MTYTVRQVVLAGLVGALGLGFPLALHAVGAGQIGAMLLPMFLPLVAGAFFLPATLAMLAGAATPLLSGLLTGMPPLAPPIAFLMMAELVAVTGIIAALRRLTGLSVWVILAIAALADRAILALLAVGLAPAFGLPQAMVTWGSLVIGLPGIAVQFVVIPPLVARLASYGEGRRAGR